MGWSVSYNKRNYGVTWTGIVESQPVQLVQPQPVTDLEAEPPGLLTWGDESQFLPLDPISYTYISAGSSGGGEDFDQGDTDAEEIIPEWTEIERTTTTVTVSDTDGDADLSVDIERIDTITFEKEDGTKVKLVLDWPA